jgi:opacity protein-like surface antigen
MQALRSITAVLLVASAALLATAATAAAKTLTVTRTDDPAPGACMPKDCSVREALNASNNSTAVGDQVVIPAATAHYEIDLGQLEITDQVEVQGAGADRVVLDAGGNSIALRTDESAILSDLTITGGLGGIQNGGELTLRRVSIEHNDRIDGGGGGIQSNGPLVVESSFIGFNSTNGAAGGAIQSNGPLTVTDSTLASNKSLGPAIQVNDDTTISSSAIVFNSRLAGGGAAAMEGSGPVTLADSILAANRDPNGPLNCSGATEITTPGGNVEDDATCSPGGRDLASTVFGLGTLELHGGTTPVFSLLPGSPPVDFAVSCPATDQRGVSRPQGPACDSGPFELEPPPPPPPSPAGDKSVSIQIGGGKVQVDGHGVARVRLTCPASEQSSPCSGALRLKTREEVEFHGKIGPVSFAKARFKVAAGKTKKVAVHLGSEKADLIRDEPKARKVLATANVADAVGNRGVVKRNLRLAPAKRR